MSITSDRPNDDGERDAAGVGAGTQPGASRAQKQQQRSGAGSPSAGRQGDRDLAGADAGET